MFISSKVDGALLQIGNHLYTRWPNVAPHCHPSEERGCPRSAPPA